MHSTYVSIHSLVILYSFLCSVQEFRRHSYGALFHGCSQVPGFFQIIEQEFRLPFETSVMSCCSVVQVAPRQSLSLSHPSCSSFWWYWRTRPSTWEQRQWRLSPQLSQWIRLFYQEWGLPFGSTSCVSVITLSTAHCRMRCATASSTTLLMGQLWSGRLQWSSWGSLCWTNLIWCYSTTICWSSECWYAFSHSHNIVCIMYNVWTHS